MTKNVAIWNRLNKLEKPNMTPREAMDSLDLNWKVDKVPLFARFNGEIVEVQNRFGIQRQDTGSVIGTGKGRYVCMQNEVICDFAEAICGINGSAVETAGMLGIGERVMMLLKVKEEMFIGKMKDKIANYIMLVNSHDGSLPFIAKFTNLRFFCFNQFALAMRQTNEQVKVRHCKNHENRIEEAKKILGVASVYWDSLSHQLDLLAKESMNQNEVQEFLLKLVPDNEEAEKSNTRTENTRNELFGLFKNGTGNNGQTRWDMFNGVTEYVDHRRTSRISEGANEAEIRFSSSLFGSGAKLKQKAFDLLLN